MRVYDQRGIPDTVINEILEVARWTGTASNRQRWRYLLIRDPKTLGALAAIRPQQQHYKTATLAIVPFADEPVDLWDQIDLGRATERLMLAAHAQGVGSCIAGFGTDESNKRKAADVLGLPGAATVPYAVTFGYAAKEQPPHPVGGGRKPLTELVHRERYGTTG